MSANQKPSPNQAAILDLAKRVGFIGVTARGITDLARGDEEYDALTDNRVLASVSRLLRRLTRRGYLRMIVQKGTRVFHDAALYNIEQVAKDAAQAAVEEIRKGGSVG